MLIAFITDIHEDIIRLNQAIALLKKRKVDSIICLGDMIGYGVPYYGFLKSRNASEVIRTIKKECDIVLIGNHDLYAIRKIPINKANFKYPKNWYNLDYNKRKELSKGKVYLYEQEELSPLINSNEKSYLSKQKEYVIKNYDGINVLLSHFIYPDFTGSTTLEPNKSKDFKDHIALMKKHNCQISIHGHDHRIMHYKDNTLIETGFKKIDLNNDLNIICCPPVSNGTYPNGVTILDTKKKQIEFIPLNTPVHVKPEWRKL